MTVERSARSVALAVLALLATVLAGLGIASPASAATSTGRGWTDHATQADHHVHVDGWALDQAHPASEVRVQLWIDGHYAGTRSTDHRNERLNRKYRLSGNHGFAFDVSYPRRAGKVTVVLVSPTRYRLADATVVREYTPGERIIMQAKRYVGYRYVEGGARPSPGFDCSGYTQYVYSTAHVASLVHNAEAQRRQARAISRAAARPGDLVFYLSGGTAYHVAIYAGNGMQYAAATPRDGVRYQRIWSSAVTFGTTWH